MPRNEKTGWRDRALSQFLVQNNLHCRAAGLVALFLEYNHKQPVALFDYRRYEAGIPNIDHPVYRAISAIELPFFVGCFDNNFGFYVWPQNSLARRLIPDRWLASEREFVSWHHEALRGGEPMANLCGAPLRPIRPLQPPMEAASVPGLLRTLDGGTWPGEEISRRHRDWGDNCPAVDLDHLLVDCNIGELKAECEFKKRLAPFYPSNTRALEAFAALVGVPFLRVRYWPSRERWDFLIENVGGELLSGDDLVTYLSELRRPAGRLERPA